MLKAVKTVALLAGALYLLTRGGGDAVEAVQIWEQAGGQVSSSIRLHEVVLVVYTAGASVVQIGLGAGLLHFLGSTVSFGGTPLRELLGGRDSEVGASLRQLRPGDRVDYDLRTWTVTEYIQYPYEGWPTDVWILESDGEECTLEYDGQGSFRLFERASVSDVLVDGESFSGGVEEAPGEIEYADADRTRYVLSEKDVRARDGARVRPDDVSHINVLVRSRRNRMITGICGGMAEYLGIYPWLIRFGLIVGILEIGAGVGGFEGAQWGSCMTLFLVGGYYGLVRTVPEPPPEQLSHYWVYESEEEALIALECADRRWTARAGREVESYEFNNIRTGGVF